MHDQWTIKIILSCCKGAKDIHHQLVIFIVKKELEMSKMYMNLRDA